MKDERRCEDSRLELVRDCWGCCGGVGEDRWRERESFMKRSWRCVCSVTRLEWAAAEAAIVIAGALLCMRVENYGIEGCEILGVDRRT